jgi:acetyl esterase/lipase
VSISPLLRAGAACLLAALAVPPVSAAEAGKLLPGDTDVVVTLNVRRFLDDHRDTEAARHHLEQWRLAQRGGEKQLRAYHRERDVRNTEGLTEEQFLERARALREISDALGVDLLQDVDRVTFGFRVGDAGSLVVLVEGRFKEEKVRAAVRRAGRFVGPEQVGLLSAGVLAVAASEDRLDGVRARAAGKKDGLSLTEQNLLDGVAEGHLAVVVNHPDATRKAAARLLEEKALTALPAGEDASALVKRLVSWLRDHETDYAAAAFGLSVGADDLRLQVALEARKAEAARELRARVGQVTFGAALALRAAGGTELSRQLADVLRRTHVSGEGTRVVVRARVPHECTRLAILAGWKALQGPGDVVVRRVTSVRLWGPVRPRPPGAVAVEEVPDVAYRHGRQADSIRHTSDLFLPRGKKGFPVVVLVHGGAWVMGDNRCCGLYSSVGHFLASQGYGVVLPNYRLAPAAPHPAQVQDVAAAVAWTCRHIAEYGGDPRRIYLLGHSAGGHLVSLLATDEAYLKAEGLTAADLKGVIAVSGIYRIPPGEVAGTLGGRGPRGYRFDQMFPLRGDSRRALDCPVPGVAARLDVFGLAFGADPKERERASPVNHVRRGLPPFLILTAANDLPAQQGTADEFHRALLRADCQARRLTVERRNHNSVLFSAIHPDDPTARAVLDFLRQQEKGK